MDSPSHGFRLDPLTWIDSAATLQAAQVRTVLLQRPHPGDAELLQAEIDRILATQTGGGLLGDNSAGRLIRLSRLGCPPAHPRVREAATAMCRDGRNDDGLLGPYEIQAAVWAGCGDAVLLAASVRALAAQVMDLDFWCACPWTGEVHLQGLLCGAEHADVAPALDRGFQVMVDALDGGTGFPPYLDPWGFLDCAGRSTHPLARQVVLRQLPLVLRGQRRDGTWGGLDHLGFGPGDRTYLVMQALLRHGLLEPLRSLPPLPPDWDVARDISLAPGKYSGLSWDGERFWTLEDGTKAAVRLSSDGDAERRLDLPAGVNSLGWSGPGLAAVRAEPNALYLLNPETGEVEGEQSLEFWGDAHGVARVGDRLAIGNLHCGGVHFVTGDGQVTPHPHMLGGSWVADLAGVDHSIWHLDGFSPAVVHSGLDRHHHLLEWGERPLGEDTAGIAAVGQDLWVLDRAGPRLCAVTRRPES